nr:TPA_inf: conotoxin precursor O1 [Conus judaeus]
MKLTCILIVAVLFLTAWTFVTADDSKNELAKYLSKARDEMNNPETSKLDKKWCIADGHACIVPILGSAFCCSGFCLRVCV